MTYIRMAVVFFLFYTKKLISKFPEISVPVLHIVVIYKFLFH